MLSLIRTGTGEFNEFCRDAADRSIGSAVVGFSTLAVPFVALGPQAANSSVAADITKLLQNEVVIFYLM